MLIKIGSALIDPDEIAAISPYSDETLSALEKATHVCIVFKQGESLWIDATMEPIDEEAYAAIENGVILSLNFPVYKSQVRFAKVLNPVD